MADRTVKGDAFTFSKYPDGCTKVVSMSSTFSYQGNPGEVVGVEISRVSANVLLRNATAHCLESVHVVAYGKVLCL